MRPSPGRMTSPPRRRWPVAARASATVHNGSWSLVASRVGVPSRSWTGVRSRRRMLNHLVASYMPRRSARRNGSATSAKPAESSVLARGPMWAATSQLTGGHRPATR